MVASTILLNETVNSSVSIAINKTLEENISTIPDPFVYVQSTMFDRVSDLILAPLNNHQMFWTIIPMLIALVLMQIYFGRNKDEALGWNTAFGNSIALIFISVSLLRGIYLSSNFEALANFSDPRILLIGGLFCYGLLLSVISFFHWLPEFVAFFIMNSVSINVIAYVIIVLTGSTIPLDRHTLFAGVIMFVIVSIVTVVLRSMIPASSSAKRKKLERLKYIYESQIKHYKDKAKKNSRYMGKAFKFEKRLSDIKQRLGE